MPVWALVRQRILLHQHIAAWKLSLTYLVEISISCTYIKPRFLTLRSFSSPVVGDANDFRLFWIL